MKISNPWNCGKKNRGRMFAGRGRCDRFRAMMKSVFLFPVFAAGLVALFAAGCDDYKSTNHKPPTGEGALVVNNQSSSRLDVFVNGAQFGSVNGGHEKAFDMTGGVYRVVLTEHNGDHSYRNDVDVLQGQDTLLSVDFDAFDITLYSVSLYFIKP